MPGYFNIKFSIKRLIMQYNCMIMRRNSTKSDVRCSIFDRDVPFYISIFGKKAILSRF